MGAAVSIPAVGVGLKIAIAALAVGAALKAPTPTLPRRGRERPALRASF